MDTIITALSILPFVAFGAAQSSSTASLFIPFADPQSLVASIAGSVGGLRAFFSFHIIN